MPETLKSPRSSFPECYRNTSHTEPFSRQFWALCVLISVLEGRLGQFIVIYSQCPRASYWSCTRALSNFARRVDILPTRVCSFLPKSHKNYYEMAKVCGFARRESASGLTYLIVARHALLTVQGCETYSSGSQTGCYGIIS